MQSIHDRVSVRVLQAKSGRATLLTIELRGLDADSRRRALESTTAFAEALALRLGGCRIPNGVASARVNRGGARAARRSPTSV